MKGLGGMFAKGDDGKAITREATCLCGASYTQQLLSERFMALVEKHGEAAVKGMLRELPGLYVPTDCPTCTRRVLGRGKDHELTPRIMMTRPQIRDRERFTRNMAQLCAAFNRPVEDETTSIYWRALSSALSDDEFEKGIISAVRSEKKWPTPATLAQYGKSERAA